MRWLANFIETFHGRQWTLVDQSSMEGRFDGEGSQDSSRTMIIVVALGASSLVVTIVSVYDW
jgi:hypothetical protein